MAQLRLEPPLGRFFQLIRPMEPVSAPKPFDSDAHYFQVKWDGVRMLVFKEGSAIRLQNRKGNPRTAQYPELQSLARLIKATDALLDGEIVVLKSGKPSFARVLRRDLAGRESVIKALSSQMPCTYCVFDLLYIDGKDLSRLPLKERLQILAGSVTAEKPLYLNDNFPSGLELYRQVVEMELEGIVAKKKESPYVFGVKSDYWLKIKPRRRLLCVVGGVTVQQGTVGSLLLGAYQDGRLLYLGRAGSGLTGNDLKLLKAYAAREAAGKPPFINPPAGKNILWLEPRLTAMIEFAEWTADLRLRAPVVIGFSNRPPEEAAL
ncbi:MAG: DNA ligase [Firmicutes bacterium]|nr:DNA ligase [Bacillota bacterium]